MAHVFISALAFVVTILTSSVSWATPGIHQRFQYVDGFSPPVLDDCFILEITGRDLFSQKDYLEKIISSVGANKLILEVDVTKGDGFVDNDGTFTMRGENLPSNLTSLALKNSTSNVTRIAGNFLYKCSQLTSLSFSTFSDITSIGAHFLSGCHGLKGIDLSPFSSLTSIGDHFLSLCVALTRLDFNPLTRLTSCGNSFLWCCHGLTGVDLSPFSNLTTIGKNFLFRCTGLTSIDLTFLSNVTWIGDSFLYECSGLTSIDLSYLTNVIRLGENFLFNCYGLTTIDLSPLEKITGFEIGFLSDCRGLKSIDISSLQKVESVYGLFLSCSESLRTINASESTSKTLMWHVVRRLRESNIPEQQDMGATLYLQYLYIPQPGLKEEMEKWNLPQIRLMTPNPLPDLPEWTGSRVIKMFEQSLDELKKSYSWKNGRGKLISEPYLSTTIQKSSTMMAVIKYCFGDKEINTIWKMYEENTGEMAISFKHMADELSCLIQTHGGRLKAATHLSQLIDALQNCQSRQAMIINQTLVSMGRINMVIDGKEGAIWSLINSYKMEAFQNFAQDSREDVHDYSRLFTVINTKLGLPVAMQGFRERISELLPQEIGTLLYCFLVSQWTPDLLMDYLIKEINQANMPNNKKEKNPLAYENIRSLYWELLGEDKTNGVNPYEYMCKLSGFNGQAEDWDDETCPLSRAELRVLLEGLRVLNPPSAPVVEIKG